MSNFSERLRFLRKQNKLTQQELADKLNLKRANIAKWETKKAIPDIDTLTSIAVFFEVSFDYLIGKIDKDYNDYNPQDLENKSHDELELLVQQAEENIYKSLALAKRQGIPFLTMKKILVELGFSAEKTETVLKVLYAEQNLDTNSAPIDTNETDKN